MIPASITVGDIATALNRRDFDSAVVQLEQMPVPLYAALVRMWGAEWLVREGRDPNVAELERSLGFWQSVGAQRYATPATWSRTSPRPPECSR